MKTAVGSRKNERTATGRILAVMSDDLAFEAAVLCAAANENPHVECRQRSTAVDLDGALGEMLGGMKSDGNRVPRRAILLSSHVHTMIFHLPVDPQKALPAHEMQNLLKWEMEPYLSRSRNRRIGMIMVGRGYIDATNLDALLAAVHERPGVKFGETAVERGMVSREQLDECLALQKSVKIFEGGAICGWTPLDDKPVNGKWKWLVAGTTSEYLAHAVGRFRRHGLKLCALYPLVGCAAANLNGRAADPAAVFEYRNGYLNYTRLSESGRVLNSRSAFTQDMAGTMGFCKDTFEADARRVWLAGGWPDPAGVAREIEAGLARPCEFVESAETQGSSQAAVTGAATHFFRRPGKDRAVCVPTRRQDPPIMSDRKFVAVLAGVLLALLLLGAQALLRGAHEGVRESLEVSGQLLQKQSQEAAARREIVERNTKIDFLKNFVPRRQRLLPSLMFAIEGAYSDEIMLKRIAEENGGIVIEGWGLTPRGIQSFKMNLQNRLPNFRLLDGDRPIRQERGWSGLNGYSFEIRLSREDGQK